MKFFIKEAEDGNIGRGALVGAGVAALPPAVLGGLLGKGLAKKHGSSLKTLSMVSKGAFGAGLVPAVYGAGAGALIGAMIPGRQKRKN